MAKAIKFPVTARMRLHSGMVIHGHCGLGSKQWLWGCARAVNYLSVVVYVIEIVARLDMVVDFTFWFFLKCDGWRSGIYIAHEQVVVVR